MATLDQIRLQQLLSPFQNQNTGIINTTSASPFINTADILNQYNVPNIQNQNLVDEIISQNIQKNMGNFINAPQDYYPGGINAGLGVLTKNNDEEDEDQVSYLGINNMTYGTPRTIADQNAVLGRTFTQQPTGIAKLFEMLGNVPTPFNLARKALGGIFGGLKGLNTKIRGTTFALSPTLKDYFAAKKMEKIAEKGADVGIGPGGTGSRRGDADIAGKDRGSFKTDDTAGFF
jgi:hypothetical protein